MRPGWPPPESLPARGVAEGDALAELAVFLQRPVCETLLIAQLDAGEVQDAVLHGAHDALAAARMRALVERRHDAERQVQTRAAVADLCARHQRRAVAEAGGGGRAAGALGNVLVHRAVFIGARTEALHARIDHARVELLDTLPGEAHAVHGAGCKILHQHVAGLHQALEDLEALLVLAVDGDRTLVVVQHREIEAVRVRHVLQLAARDVAHARTLDLDHVGAEPGEKLGAGGARLHVGEIENANVFECFHLTCSLTSS